MNKHRVFNLVLTGGPCGGKTSSINFLKEKLEEKGFKVLAIPEGARQLNSIGLKFEDVAVYDFQNVLVKKMIFNEKEAIEITRFYDQDVIILYDRALLDNKAYMSYNEFVKVFALNGLSERYALYRYDAVFHLVTAANGALEYYMLDNTRHETPEEACQLDLATQEAWKNHPNHIVIDNSTDFDGKLNRLLNEILKIVG